MTLDEFRSYCGHAVDVSAAGQSRIRVFVGMGTCGVAAGADELWNALTWELATLVPDAMLVKVGCIGMCEQEPLIDVELPGEPRFTYGRATVDQVPRIVRQHVLGGRPVSEWVVGIIDDEDKPYRDLDFFARQRRVVLANCGFIDPEHIEEFIARDGYAALLKAMTEMTPDDVINEMMKSGLRGRGGAGFPTGLKWKLARQSPGDKKYIVCNGDEGDPGAFMDRSVLEGDPHAVLEGMMIAAYAIGSDEGYLYVRAEYPLAIKRLKMAIQQATELGLLGPSVLGTGRPLVLRIKEGAGAFVCGEETALFASIEGERGMPRPRPPFPAEKGLWGKPTNNNNVETYANVPAIIRRGGDWFGSIGTQRSKGSKVFALTGKIAKTGLAEVPIGVPLGEIVYDIGGGIKGGLKCKAVQIGGPSGGCIPTHLFNIPVDYESLVAAGAMMGSGGLVVLDEGTCMVDLARFFVAFTESESCGKCTPCREGTKRMLEILNRICDGKGRPEDIGRLEMLGTIMKDSALCGLGQTAPNPVLTTIKYFRDEYDAHILDKKCPASVCAALFDSPCQNTCPANVDVPMYINHIKRRQFGEAYMEVMRENPFPVVCGRVCDHPCESKCRRSQLDDPLAIRPLKRFAADWAMAHPDRLPVTALEPARGTRVAIIGSGPAGLTAAYYLQKAGHEVTVFEALPVAGGMLAVGIPEYRLPKDALDWEIEAIKRIGVKIRLNTQVGKDISFDDLRKQFNAVFIAVGSHGNQKLGVPGEDLQGVAPGVSFLRDVALGRPGSLEGRRVAVIGGGNVAIDAARTAKRLGASEVTIVYRRRLLDMPALVEEIEEAQNEGIKFLCLANPSRIGGDDGRVTGLSLVTQKLGDFDSSGRRRPVPVPGSEHVLQVDIVIPAVGQATESAVFAEAGLETRRGDILCDSKTGATGMAGVFAGGDCVTGPDSVVSAIGAGKRAASAIDKFLGGTGEVVEPQLGKRRITGTLMEDEQPRTDPALLPADRRAGFAEVEQAFDEEAAVAEASRCLRCDVKE